MKNLMGILGFALVLGLGMVMTSCEDTSKVEIRVSNNSQYEADSTVTARVYMQGRGDALATQSVPNGQAVSFSFDAGTYRVVVSSGGGSSHSYPQDSSFINMSGDVRLSFNGSTLSRSN